MSSRRASIASLVAIVALAVGFVLTAFSLPIDDFWLSIASGRAIVAGADPGRAIDVNWLPLVPNALNSQWGAQLVLGALGSLELALVVNAILIGATLVLTAIRTSSRASAEATAVAMLLVLAALAPHLLARVQSFSLFFFALTLLLLERWARSPFLPPAFAGLAVVWANVHGGFVIGLLAVACAFIGSLADWRGRSRLLGVTLALGAIAPLVNPVGLELVGYVVNQPASDVVRAISVEWQPAWPWIPVATPFWLLLALVVIGRMVRRPGISLGEGVLLTALAALAISGIRHLPWFILASTSVIASDIEAALSRSTVLREGLGSIGSRLRRRGAVAVAILALAAVLLQLLRPSLPQGVARLTPDEPAALVDRIDAELAGRCCVRILNEQVWGGYLAYRLGDRVETAMDGRLEIRSRDTWIQYFDLLHGEGNPAASLADEDVAWALVRPDRRELLRSLTASGWQIVEQSVTGVLLEAPDEAR